ncbi:MAG TPA: AMP-binding protein, partial [Burkholderiales bacterium]|nr:AMP-binding protein [Burkholderiales bacterium]
MRGLMMDMPLLVSSLIAHADRSHGDAEIVSRTVEGPGKDGAGAVHRYTYSEAHKRSKQLAQALARIGVKQGERVGTLAWNGYRHVEIYYAASGSQLVCHTVNPRLFPEQIA